jgi:hypothetical protein
MKLVKKRLKFMYCVSIKIPNFRGTALYELDVSRNRTERRMDVGSVTDYEN